MTHVFKQSTGKSENFDSSKLYRSLYSAALGANTPPGQAQIAAQRVILTLEPWLQSKKEVTTGDIRRKAGEGLRVYNPQAAYLYGNQHHPTHRKPEFDTPHSQPTNKAAYRPDWLNIGKGGHWE